MSSEDRSDGVTTDRLDGVPIGVEYKSSVVKTSVTGAFTTLFGLDVHEGFDSQRGQDGLIEYSADLQIDDGKVNVIEHRFGFEYGDNANGCFGSVAAVHHFTT